MKRSLQFFSRGWPALALLSFVAFLAWMVCRPAAPILRVEAQGSGQNTYTLPFSIAASATTTIVTIPNVNQIGDAVSYQWGTSPTNCIFTLDGSNDQTNWFSTAAASANSGQTAGYLISNGYWTFHRLKFSNCSRSTGAPVATGTYVGYGQTLAINPVTTSLPTFSIASVTSVLGAALGSPFLLQGFQCFNPNGSTAFLQLFNSLTSPTLGSSTFYQVGIPAGALFSYSGPPIVVSWSTVVSQTSTINILYAGASTAAGGSTAVSSGLTCTFTLNAAGPFYPLTPISP